MFSTAMTLKKKVVRFVLVKNSLFRFVWATFEDVTLHKTCPFDVVGRTATVVVMMMMKVMT